MISTTSNGEHVQEGRPPFDQHGFPIPNQQWRSVTDAQPANAKSAKEYHVVDGSRVPLIEAASMRARDFRKLQEEKRARKADVMSLHSGIVKSAVPPSEAFVLPNETALEPDHGMSKRKREDENDHPHSDSKRMRTTAFV
ncbi:hypothetical protein CERZMDRAFT_94377 [Cercospora zeae-maydis SCOH1-5]|uniref:Uncharacterized protein n=1 Tax=Cercospora zeae-maydis SCOH1-5 TaxID=717836 RepID=A0A6A6FR86_9PEZI|nr:hypothetical protein CERZMDRAFT_94377 [Cercospora zeae-maydis SCOH1-5]